MSQTKYQLQSLHKLVHPANIGLARISVEIASFFFLGHRGSIAQYINCTCEVCAAIVSQLTLMRSFLLFYALYV